MVDIKREFNEVGFVRMRRFFTRAEVAFLSDTCSRASTQASQNCLTTGGLVFASNLFRADDALRGFLAQDKVVRIMCAIGGEDLWVRWDQAVLKRPGAQAFPWHQDNAYNRLKHEHYQLWVAIDICTRERGGVAVIPGSHRCGHLSHKRSGNHLKYLGSVQGATIIDAEPGDVIVFSSLLLHYTFPNVSPWDRWVYVAEYAPLSVSDPSVPAPYLVVARNGQPCCQIVTTLE